jgi:hypothetical protein
VSDFAGAAAGAFYGYGRALGAERLAVNIRALAPHTKSACRATVATGSRCTGANGTAPAPLDRRSRRQPRVGGSVSDVGRG